MKEEKNWKKRDDREKEKALFRVFQREKESARAEGERICFKKIKF